MVVVEEERVVKKTIKNYIGCNYPQIMIISGERERESVCVFYQVLGRARDGQVILYKLKLKRDEDFGGFVRNKRNYV